MGQTVSELNLLGASKNLLGFAIKGALEEVSLDEKGDLYVTFKHFEEHCTPVWDDIDCSGSGWRANRVLVASGASSFSVFNPGRADDKSVVDSSVIYITGSNGKQSVLNITSEYAIKMIEEATGLPWDYAHYRF